MTPQQRQEILRRLKYGPNFGDRQKLAEYSLRLVKALDSQKKQEQNNSKEKAED